MEEYIEALRAHEFAPIDDGKHIECVTCGARHLSVTRYPAMHKYGCAYAELIEIAEHMLHISKRYR